MGFKVHLLLLSIYHCTNSVNGSYPTKYPEPANSSLVGVALNGAFTGEGRGGDAKWSHHLQILPAPKLPTIALSPVYYETLKRSSSTNYWLKLSG